MPEAVRSSWRPTGIIAATAAKLADNALAVWVGGEMRYKARYYCGFMLDTFRAFEDTGMSTPQ